MEKKVILIILDGWGIGSNPDISAIAKARTPFIDSLYTAFPNSRLLCSGMSVGLPDGQMGNSEVGHMNIGAGRVVYQDIVKINQAIKNGDFFQHTVLKDAFKYAKEKHKKVHLTGLLSDGGVHSHIDHLKALCTAADREQVNDLFVHVFTDGRDTDPKSGKKHIMALQTHLKKTTGRIATVIGRYYAMDRDQRWERIKLAYNAMVKGIGTPSKNIMEAVDASYQQNITDEFIKPIIHTNDKGEPLAMISPGDVVLSFNFRADRGRQITQALSQENYPGHGMQALDLYYITMTNYDNTFGKVQVIFDKDPLDNTLGEVISKAGKTQIRIAETEKYPHVTYFFSGGRESPFPGEKRILCPSPKVATYDLKPEMSAWEVKNQIISALCKKEADFICLNFANPDMVGHTGVFEAAVKACETVDQCTKETVNAALENGYTALVLADHGNAECMINKDGSIHTAHTTNPVPLFLISSQGQFLIKDGKLADVAPTVLKMMGLAIPEEMTGKILI